MFSCCVCVRAPVCLHLYLKRTSYVYMYARAREILRTMKHVWKYLWGKKLYSIDLCLSARLMHIGQILNGLAGPVASAAPPFLSAIWFAPHERTTATAIAVMLNSLGMAVMFVLGQCIVSLSLPLLFLSLLLSFLNDSVFFLIMIMNETMSLCYLL